MCMQRFATSSRSSSYRKTEMMSHYVRTYMCATCVCVSEKWEEEEEEGGGRESQRNLFSPFCTHSVAHSCFWSYGHYVMMRLCNNTSAARMYKIDIASHSTAQNSTENRQSGPSTATQWRHQDENVGGSLSLYLYLDEWMQSRSAYSSWSVACFSPGVRNQTLPCLRELCQSLLLLCL